MQRARTFVARAIHSRQINGGRDRVYGALATVAQRAGSLGTCKAMKFTGHIIAEWVVLRDGNIQMVGSGHGCGNDIVVEKLSLCESLALTSYTRN